MSKIISNIFFVFFLFLLSGCNPMNDVKFEKNIYENLFGELIDSTMTDYRRFTIPSSSDFERAESIKKLNIQIIDSEKQHVSPLIVYVKDTIDDMIDINHIHNKIKSQLSRQDYESIVSNSVNQTKESYIIKLQSLRINPLDYELRDHSIRLKDKKLLKGSEKDRISGTYYLSRIHFDEEKTLGFFTLDLVYGKLNAVGAIVIIKKEKDKWVIKKIIENWVS